MNYLSRGQWVKGDRLAHETGVNRRLIRAMAEETGCLISGQNGYKRTDLGTADELEHALNDYRSRANKLNARAGKTESFFNRNAGLFTISMSR